MNAVLPYPIPHPVARPRTTVTDVVVGVADGLHRADERWARANGLHVRRVGLTGRAYSHPAFLLRGGAR